MALNKARVRTSLRWGLGLAIVVAVVGRCEGSELGTAALAAQAVGWSQPRLVLLPAATRVGDSAPEGWSHLVMKSIPRLVSGDRDTLPASASKTASLFRTVMLADVQPVGLDKEYILSRIGIGMCVPARDGKDEDIVVASDRLQSLSIRLSTIEQLVLDIAEGELAEARIVARTPTFALLRTPAMLVVAGKHRKVDLYYAFCVDRATGRLHVGVWSMWPGTNPQSPPPALIELAPRTRFDCAVDVHAKRLLGTIPLTWSFAMRKLPPGRPVDVPATLGQPIVTVARHPAEVDAAELERMLRQALSPTPDSAAKRVGYQTLPPPAYRESGH
ncbi:MAG TPA: hypothetical protein VFF52_18075 [Isosphaeraceae bacterium]|nr:hypothetical protein [Isosphaeraceae bacterium]